MNKILNSIPAVEGITTINPGEGQAFDLGAVHFKWKVRSEDSAHHYTVFELTLAPEQGVDLHSHPSPETFYVLEGTVNFFRISDGKQETIACTAGTTVNIPPNALHALFNQSDKDCRLLDISTCSHQSFFDAALKANAEQPFEQMQPHDLMQRMRAIARDHEMYLAPYDVKTGQEVQS